MLARWIRSKKIASQIPFQMDDNYDRRTMERDLSPDTNCRRRVLGSKSLRNLRFVVLGLLFSLAAAINPIPAWSFETEPFSIEPVTPRASTSFPQKIVDALDPQGSLLFTYSHGLKLGVCEIFWVKTAVAQDSPPGSSKTSYSALKPGALLGVIHFLPEANEDYLEDFHDQKLKPGYYTMRYAALPDTDTVDFVLLSPLSMDRDPSLVLPPEELFRLSRGVSHTKHPAVMSLVPIDLRGKDFPDVRTDGEGTWTLQAKLHLRPSKGDATKEIAVSLVVITPKKEEEGS
jgi:hypothetical protein